VADIIIQKDPEFQLIDVRSQDAFEKFSLPNAINVPLPDILSEDYRDIMNQDVKRNILYSNGTIDAMKAWMITSQLGWENNYVMEGGLNYWVEVIMNPLPPASANANEEIAKYQFRKAAGQALSGEAEVNQATTTSTEIAKPPIKRRPQRKRVEGGC
jgi:rhodanese-related sulfurtransferase